MNDVLAGFILILFLIGAAFIAILHWDTGRSIDELKEKLDKEGE